MGRLRKYEGDEKERRRTAARISYGKHKVEINARKRERYPERKTEHNRKQRERYAREPEKFREQARIQHMKHRRQRNQQQKEHRRTLMKNPEFREKEQLRGREKAKLLRLLAYQKLGNKCCRCGFNNPKCLEIHHRVPIRRKAGQSTWTATELRRLIKMTEKEANEKFALVCANCHKLEEAHQTVSPFVRYPSRAIQFS